MSSRNFKTALLVLEAFNAVGTTLYFYYFYFFMQEKFGFGTEANLMLAATLGMVNAIAAIYGGRFAQKYSCMTSLRVGFLVMGVAILSSSQLNSAAGHVGIAVIAMAGMCFTWPALQAAISENEPAHRLQKYVGLYNFTWATSSAAAYFVGGALIEKFGVKSMLFVPATIHLLQFCSTFLLPRKPTLLDTAPVQATSAVSATLPPNAGLFLKMAWLANPFAYLAINTVVAVTPTLAKQLNLSPRSAGFLCSIWFFVRAASFIILWLWPKWHYRFRWLLGAYFGLIASFAAILLVKALWVLILAQVVFGVSLGLIYYSSLFYSMDVSETKARHGGIHEAAIGAGCFAGPAIGATALHFFPHQPNSGAMAVSALLMCGLAGLLWMRTGKARSAAS